MCIPLGPEPTGRGYPGPPTPRAIRRRPPFFSPKEPSPICDHGRTFEPDCISTVIQLTRVMVRGISHRRRFLIIPSLLLCTLTIKSTMPTASPGTATVECPDCHKTYKNKRSLREHRRHHCKKCKTTTPRKYTPVKCKHCGQVFHSANSLRVHASTQHIKEYARSPRSVKDHRAPLRAKRPSSSRGAREEPRASSRETARRQQSTDELLQQYANSGDRRSRDIWEQVLRRQMQNTSSKKGRRDTGGLGT
jgi:hypothetical protein